MYILEFAGTLMAVRSNGEIKNILDYKKIKKIYERISYSAPQRAEQPFPFNVSMRMKVNRRKWCAEDTKKLPVATYEKYKARWQPTPVQQTSAAEA